MGFGTDGGFIICLGTSSSRAWGSVKVFIKNTTRGTRVEIFSKTRRAPTLTCVGGKLPCLSVLFY